ncbi:MAG: T9SS type A sorting domain-containing protein [Fidelibacterota bacterium]
MRTTSLILITLLMGLAFGKEAPTFFNKKHASGVKRQATQRVATGKQLKESALRREWEPKLKAMAKRHQAAAKTYLKYQQRTSTKEEPAFKKQEPDQVDKVKGIMRLASQWRHGFHPGPAAHMETTSLRDVPVVTINGLSAATISPGSAFTISINLGTGVDSALVDVFFDADGDTLVDSTEISLLGVHFPDDGGPQGPFWVFDNSPEDEDPTVGIYTITIDDFPYVGLDVIMQATTSDGTGQAYLTVLNLTGSQTISGVVAPVTAPALLLYAMDEQDPWFTFTDSAGNFTFQSDIVDYPVIVGAMQVNAPGSYEGTLLVTYAYNPGDDLTNLSLDITRDADVYGTVTNTDDGLPIERALVESFGMQANRAIISFGPTDSLGVYSNPLQGGVMYWGVKARHPEFYGEPCLDGPFYVSPGDTLLADCSLTPWPAFIEGTVTNSNGDVLPDIAVVIGMDSLDFWNQTWTDMEGNYRLGTMLGTGTLCALDWDYDVYQPTCISPFEVSNPLVYQDLVMQPWDGAIEVTVIDSVSGNPIVGAWVEIYGQDQDFYQEGNTDESGQVLLPAVNGNYTVCATAWDQGYDWDCIDTVVVDNDTVGVTLVLVPPASFFEGYVFDDQTNTPVAGITVSAINMDREFVSITDDSGFFRIGVDNDDYDICYFDWTATYGDTCVGPISVQDEVYTLPDMYLTAIDYDGAMTGSVADQFATPVPAMVVAVDTLTEEEFVTMSDYAGQYFLPVMNGNYIAMAFPFDEFHLPGFAFDILVQDDTVTVDLLTPAFIQDAVIFGSVTDTLGNSLPNAWVTAVTWAGPDWELWFDTETDSLGDYTLNVVGFNDRTYWLHAEYWQDTGVLMGGADDISVLSGDTVEVNLVLAPLEITSFISGHVTAQGAPLGGVEVYAWNNWTGDYFEDWTNAEGYYEFWVTNGDYEVCAYSYDYDEELCDNVYVEDDSVVVDFDFGAPIMWLTNTYSDLRFDWSNNGLVTDGEWPAGSGRHYLAGGGLITLGYRDGSDTTFGGIIDESWQAIEGEFGMDYGAGREFIYRGIFDGGTDWSTHIVSHELVVNGENEDFVVVGSSFTYDGWGMLTEVRVGYGMDWDVASTDTNDDSYDDDLTGAMYLQVPHPILTVQIPITVSYMYDDDGDNGNSPGYVGFATLTPNMLAMHHISLDILNDDPETLAELVDLLESDVDSPADTIPSDYVLMQLTDPFTLSGGDTLYMATIFMATDSLEGFATLVQEAVDRVFETFNALGQSGVALPQQYALYPNYPNPFNPTTNFQYDLPQAGPVKLVIYNLLGEEVARLVDRVQPAGRYTISWNADQLASGVYLYRLEAGDYQQTRKLTILK